MIYRLAKLYSGLILSNYRPYFASLSHKILVRVKQLCNNISKQSFNSGQKMHSKYPVAVHIFFLRENEVLLARRHQTGYEDGNYSVVAGHLEAGETLTQAAIREANEEAGVILRPQDLEMAGVMHRRAGDERVDFFMVARTWEGSISNREPEKCSELGWFSLEALPANLIPYVRQALSNYFEGKWFQEYGWI